MNAGTKTLGRRIAPGLLRREQAAEYCGVSVACWDRWTASATNPKPRKVGGSVLWSRHELAEWSMRGCPIREEWEPTWKAILAAR